MAGVVLGDIDRHFAWQAWHLVTLTVVLRGWRGTYGTGLALVTRLIGSRLTPWGRRGTWDIDLHFAAGVALMALDWLVTRLGPVGRRGRHGRLRGRCGTW